MSFPLLLRRTVVDTEMYKVIQVSEPMRPTSFGQAEFACKSLHFAICPRLT